MASGDGLIVRIRPRLGRLSIEQLEILGIAAHSLGDGNLYLSNRANVQIRGVAAAVHPALLDVLAATQLIDSDPRVEAVRNVMLVPAFGRNACPGPAAELAAKLEGLLANKEVLQELPGKFGAAVQTSGAIDAGAISDVTFVVQKDRIAMLMEGDPGRGIIFDGVDAAVDGFMRAAMAFLKLRKSDPNIRRMRGALSKHGLDWITKEAGLQAARHGLGFCDAPAPAGDLGEAFGMAFAFGEVTQEALREITATMRRQGIAEAAVSPHRALIFAADDRNKVEFQITATRIGAITDLGDMRLRVHACPGAPACSRATVPARRGAEDVLQAFDDFQFHKGTIHISGCEKCCAFPHRADITAIGAHGRYKVTGPRLQIRNGVPQEDLARAVAELARSE
jgi:precorrin-3B synthase